MDGILAKASLFGTKTVNGPVLLSVSTKPATPTAVRKVDKSGFATSASRIVPLFSENRAFRWHSNYFKIIWMNLNLFTEN